VNSRATKEFWECFDALPEGVRRVAEQNYQFWVDEPFHPSLHFKQLKDDLWSVRAGMHYRALGLRYEEDGVDTIAWYWIGTHNE
jgi:hypothetical protein